LGFDARASCRVHNPKDALVTKYCDLRAMKRASPCDLRAKNPKVVNDRAVDEVLRRDTRNDKTHSRLFRLVPYMLRGKGEDRCTWYMAGSLPGLDRREDPALAVDVMELLSNAIPRAASALRKERPNCVLRRIP